MTSRPSFSFSLSFLFRLFFFAGCSMPGETFSKEGDASLFACSRGGREGHEIERVENERREREREKREEKKMESEKKT